MSSLGSGNGFCVQGCSSHSRRFFIRKPKMPNARTKNRMKVPNLPAFDFRARSQMIHSMKAMKKPRPQVRPMFEICCSDNGNVRYP